MKLRAILILALAGAGIALRAETPPPPPPPPENHGEPGDYREEFLQRYLDKLRKEDAPAAERLERLREEDPKAFHRALMQQMRERGWAGNGPRGGKQGGFVERILERLKKEKPEEYERLTALREEDPEAFREELRGLFRGHGRDFYRQRPEVDLSAYEARINELRKTYDEAETEAAKVAARDELRGVLEEVFDRMMAVEEAKLEQLEKEMERMRGMIEKRRSLRDRVVDRRLQDLLDNQRPQRRQE